MEFDDEINQLARIKHDSNLMHLGIEISLFHLLHKSSFPE